MWWLAISRKYMYMYRYREQLRERMTPKQWMTSEKTRFVWIQKSGFNLGFSEATVLSRSQARWNAYTPPCICPQQACSVRIFFFTDTTTYEHQTEPKVWSVNWQTNWRIPTNTWMGMQRSITHRIHNQNLLPKPVQVSKLNQQNTQKWLISHIALKSLTATHKQP